MDEDQSPGCSVEGSSRGPHTISYHYNAPVNNIGQATNTNFGVNSGAINYSGDPNSLPKLSPIPDATHNRNRLISPPNSICLAGTRQNTLEGMTAWALDATFHDDVQGDEAGQVGPLPFLVPKSSHVLWLCGPVGCGKSAISQTLARELAKKGQLLGSFFFFKDSVARSRILGVAVTLATQMRHAIPAMAPLVDAKLETWGLEQMSAADQFRVLIFEPLLSLGQLGGAFLAVLDGLDECSDHAEVGDLVDYILDAFDEHPHLPLRFLITSRIEEHVREHIQRPGVHIEDLNFHTSESRNDIAVLVNHKLRIAAQQKRIVQAHGEPWPTPHDVERLIERAEGSFIFISMLLDYILGVGPEGSQDNVLTPMERLDLAFDMNGLDNLYEAILHRARHLPHFHEVILTFAMAFDPLSARDLACLLEIRPFQVISVFLPLQSIVHLPGKDWCPIRAFHASFIDFLRAGTRSHRLFPEIERRDCYLHLSYRCLQMVFVPESNLEIPYAALRWHDHWLRLSLLIPSPHDILIAQLKRTVSQPRFQIAFHVLYHGYCFVDPPWISPTALSQRGYRFWSRSDTVIQNFPLAFEPHPGSDEYATDFLQIVNTMYAKPFPRPDPSMNRCIAMHAIYALLEPASRSHASWVNYSFDWWAYHTALAVAASPNDLDESGLLDFLQIPFLPPRYITERDSLYRDPDWNLHWREICPLLLCDPKVACANLECAIQAINSKFPKLLDLGDGAIIRIPNYLSSMPTFMFRVDHQGLSVLDMVRLAATMFTGLRLDSTGVGVRVMLPGEIAWSFFLGQGIPDQCSPGNVYSWAVTPNHTDGAQGSWGHPGLEVTTCIASLSFPNLFRPPDGEARVLHQAIGMVRRNRQPLSVEHLWGTHGVGAHVLEPREKNPGVDSPRCENLEILRDYECPCIDYCAGISPMVTWS